jgi:sugar phosphate isomerase/epimerase
MKPIDGKVPYDVFVQGLDPKSVSLQLDVGNMMVGGGDPVKYFAKYRDRYGTFHLKDTVANHSTDAELGTGVFDFKSFLRSIPNLASKPCYVEQENPKEELASARANFQYLKTLNF